MQGSGPHDETQSHRDLETQSQRDLETLILAISTNELEDPQATFFDAVERCSVYETMLLLSLPTCTIDVSAARANDGRTALHVAAASGQGHLISVLLERGADSSLRDHAGNSAADLARRGGHTAVAALLRHGAGTLIEETPGAENGYHGETGAGSERHEGYRGSNTSEDISKKAFTAKEVAILKSLCASAAAAAKSGGSPRLGATAAYTLATTKRCPNPACGLPQTHYHGHACHHVREGCYSCKIRFCYSCLATAEENRRKRGQEHLCRCGSWSKFCDNGDLLAHIELMPYPYDRYFSAPNAVHSQ